MNDQNQISDDAQNGLQDIFYEISQTAKWAKVISIISMVFLGIYLIIVIFLPSMIQGAMSQNPMVPSSMPAGFSFFVRFIGLLAIAIAAIPTYFLYKFASESQNALKGDDIRDLAAGLSFLRKHYTFIGILSVVIVSIYAFIFLIGIISAMFS